MQNFFLNNLWRWKCGLPEIEAVRISNLNFENLERTEWPLKFETLMRNRMILGAMRYGRLNTKGKPQYDRINSIRERLTLYEKSRNTEILVDIANLCLCEFEEGNHPLKHFKSIDDGIHTKVKNDRNRHRKNFI